MTESERKRRIGENEAVFRNVNEQIKAITSTLTTPMRTMSIVCECGLQSCTDRFEVTLTDYERVRSEPTQFFVKPGHDLPETETVVEKQPVYWIVEKDPGLPAAIARATDPNAGT